MLDVGAGDGLIAFGALDQLGERGQVIFNDISQDLLERSRSLAEETGVLDRCSFLQTSAEDLGVLEDASVDVVTARSVLIYVTDKRRAFEEFYRVLKPGGRVSIFEPIMSFAYPKPEHWFLGYDMTPVLDLVRKVRAVYHRLQPPETDTMINFDERDLFAFAEKANFEEVHLELQASVVPSEKLKWDAYLRTAWNPRAPTLEEAMDESLTPDEIERFVAHLRPLVESGRGSTAIAVAYLWADEG